MQRRGEFSFPGSPARGLPPRAPPPPGTATAPRYGEEEEEVRWLQASRQASPDYSSGGGSSTPSPRLWAVYQPDPLHRLFPASAGSSPSRAQAIAGYRREMLDLVRGLPESAYELSLRDIVEHRASSSPPPPPEPLPQPPNAAAAARQNHTDAAAQASDEPAGTNNDATAAEALVQDGKKQSGSGKKQRTMRKQRSRSLERSVSLDTGLLIKFFLPLSIGGKKKVSPRPDAAKDGKKKDKEKKKQGGKKKKQQQPEAAPAPAQEEEWWIKSEFSEAGGSSRTSSTGSSSSNGSMRNGHGNGSGNPRAPARSWSRKRTGCYPFFRGNKSKNGVGQD